MSYILGALKKAEQDKGKKDGSLSSSSPRRSWDDIPLAEPHGRSRLPLYGSAFVVFCALGLGNLVWNKAGNSIEPAAFALSEIEANRASAELSLTSADENSSNVTVLQAPVLSIAESQGEKASNPQASQSKLPVDGSAGSQSATLGTAISVTSAETPDMQRSVRSEVGIDLERWAGLIETISLNGILIMPRSESGGSAFINGNSYRVGDEVMPGVFVDKIEADAVILSHGDDTWRVSL